MPHSYRDNSDLGWFPETTRTPEDEAEEAERARLNQPSVVIGQALLILAVTLAAAVATNVGLALFDIH